MARENQRYEQEFIASAKEKTGKDVSGWMGVVKGSGLDKPNAIIKWLKEDHKLNHAQATFIAGIYLNGGQPVYDYERLFANLFNGKDNLLPVYRELEKRVKAKVPEADCVPTKTYISIEGKRCFACATMTSKNIRVGLDLGDRPFDEVVQKAKSLGAMPNLTHMIEVNQIGDVNDQLIDFVRQAYDRVHKR
jgi:Domain of unknown function (DUF5655)/Domain of unknown function (DUF4287)